MQYNLSYDNDGPGYLVYTGVKNDVHRNSVVRFNVSSGDARNWSVYGGITVLGRVTDVDVYHNTVVMAPQAADPSSALRIGPGVQGLVVRNNVLYADRAGPVVVSVDDLDPDAAVLQGNSYFATDREPGIVWGGHVYLSLERWRGATGQERVDGRPAGLSDDPRLTGPVHDLTATGPEDPAALRGFAPAAGSPLLGNALEPARFGPPPVVLPSAPPAPPATDVGAVQLAPDVAAGTGPEPGAVEGASRPRPDEPGG
jgi:hypothetical protein